MSSRLVPAKLGGINNKFSKLYAKELFVDSDSIHIGSQTIKEDVENQDIQFSCGLTLPGIFKGKGAVNSEDGLHVMDSQGNTKLHMFVSGLHTQDVGKELPQAFDNSFILEFEGIKNSCKMEAVFWDGSNERPMLVLNEGVSGRASIFDRSVIIGDEKGSKSLDSNYTKGDGYSNLDFDTSNNGADLGVEHDLEVKGLIFVDQIKESSLGSGVKINNLKTDNVQTDNLTNIDTIITDTLHSDSVTINDSLRMFDLISGGDRNIRVDDNGFLYAV